MEQIFIIEVFVQKIIFKIEPPVEDEKDLKLEEEERRSKAETLAAAEAAKRGKKVKPQPKPKKEKKGKQPPMPSGEEMKFMQTCTVQMTCLPLFDFYVAHDNFIAPPPPPGIKGKKENKPKKEKKGKKLCALPKIILPSEPLPQPPYYGVGNAVIFISRPSHVEEIMKKTPIYIRAWNRDQEVDCIGFCEIDWHKSFIECLKKASELNPVDMDQAEFRATGKQEMVTNTVGLTRPLQCEDGFLPSGEVEFFIRLTCLGNKVVSNFVALPEMDRIPGRKYLTDDLKLKDLEVVRHWEGTLIEEVPPVAYFFGALDITREPIRPVEEPVVYEDFVADYTASELAILSMGFPKGPCGGTNCLTRMEYRGNEYQFIAGETDSGVYTPGKFVNKRDVHGPCGTLDCPLAMKVRTYLRKEGRYKSCKKPCPKEYY